MMNNGGILSQGGPVMALLLPLSVIAFSVIVERVWVLGRERKGAFLILAQLEHMAPGEDFSGELLRLLQDEKFRSLSVGRILQTLLSGRGVPEQMERLSRSQGSLEEISLRKNMWILDTTITMAPLLGLLGTILGIVVSFHVMNLSGLKNPSQITGGVAQALIATATGLLIAIITLGFNNFLLSRIRNIHLVINAISGRLLLLLGEGLKDSGLHKDGEEAK